MAFFRFQTLQNMSIKFKIKTLFYKFYMSNCGHRLTNFMPSYAHFAHAKYLKNGVRHKKRNNIWLISEPKSLFLIWKLSTFTLQLIGWVDFKIKTPFPLQVHVWLISCELRTFRAQYLSAIEAGKVVNLLPTIMKGHLQKHTEEQ